MRTTSSLMLLLAALTLQSASISAMETPPPSAAESAPAAVDAAPITKTADYMAMEKLLASYRALAANGGWPMLKSSDKKITPGSTDPRIATIRTILAKMGDYSEQAVTHPEHYDETLVAAVKLFQERHGLTDDGIIGKTTLIALATPVEKRIAQISSTMKRMQTMPTNLGKRFLFVNLPEFRLRGFENGEMAMDMRVVVGAPKTSTPTFHNEISYVSFNPQWGVPAKIARNELLPKIIKDPSYLKNHDYAIYDMSSDGVEEVNPSTVDWDSVHGSKFPYQIRQRAGKKNALGKVKFGMIGTNDIYLHDTASPSFFAKDERALSHGCIRVEHPYELAQFVFKDMEKFTPEKVESIYKESATKTLQVKPLPVHLVYWTAWVDPTTGRPQFRKDIYNMDKI